MKKSLAGYYVYILSNRYQTTYYVGVTNDLERRILEHKAGLGSDFTNKYNCHHLLYYETFPDISQAIAREKVLKRWHRRWKIELITSLNPLKEDLAMEWYSSEDIEALKVAK